MLNKIIKKISWFFQNITYDQYRRKYAIASSFRFNGYGIRIYGDGQFVFGENSYIGELSTCQSFSGYKVSIGEKCKISHNVRIYTQSAMADSDFSLEDIPTKRGDVIINNFVWIGANVLIDPGVTIGENAIIGANSVVTKDVEPFSIVGGVPAKFIRMKRCYKSNK